MASAEKTLQKMRNSPRDWRIEDLKVIADRLGISYRQKGTSHVMFLASNGKRANVPAHKPIKPPYIRQFLALIDGLEATQ